MLVFRPSNKAKPKPLKASPSELRTHISTQGLLLPSEHEFIDDGYSGATLIRPALERLRDVAAAGGLDRLSVLCPDRLARNYAHQVLLLEELLRAGVEVNFLNREVGQTPEDQLLLQVQGMISEYERARNHGTQSPWQVARGAGGHDQCAFRGAPYGYRYTGRA
jgi:site-specific DNA recombinase